MLGNSSGNRISDTLTGYNSLGEVYQTTVIGVDPTTGDENCGSLVSNTWRDPDGNPIETQDGGTRQFTKTTFDGLDRPSVVYVGFDPNGDASTYATAGSVAADIILQQTNTNYDDAGDAILVTTYERYDDAPTTDLGEGAQDNRRGFGDS